jgi:formate/nitrite transporter FocA (FNT family)
MSNSNKEKEIEKKVDDLNKNANKPKSQEKILVDQLCEGIETYEQHKSKVFIGALTAGLEIGFSYLLIAILYTFLKGKFAEATIFYIVAFAYPIGFIIVVLGKSILFTEQTSLLALPVLHKKRTILELVKLWTIVIFGNLVGGAFMAVFIVLVGTGMGIISYDSVSAIALHVTKGSVAVIFGSAIMAGWLMALLSWLVTSSSSTMGRIFVIYMITAIVGFAGFHHSIVGNIEVLAGVLFTDSISIGTYAAFQATALFGNAFGGVFFVALLRYRAFAANF